MSAKVGFKDIETNVLERKICTGCGGCVVVCPYNEILEYSDGGPKAINECKVCGICSKVCPRYNTQTDELEKLVFGRTRKPEEEFGIFREIQIARSLDDEVLKRCQDGGIASTLINSALDSGMIDGAIVSGINPSVPWFPMPLFAINKYDIYRSAGTRYTYSPNILALGKLVTEGSKKKVAFVGTPCQILAIRRMQEVPLKKFTDIIAFTIGLFCSESFTYDGLMIKKIRDGMGVDLKDIEKMNIKGKLLLTLKSGKVIEIPLKEVRNFSEDKCRYCGDFSSELADISVGGVSLEGRTFTIIRTEQGEKIFNQASKMKTLETKPAKESEQAYNLLIRLSKIKHKNNHFLSNPN